MSLACTISEIWRDTGRKSPIVTYPPLFSTLVGGDPAGILPRSLETENKSPWAIIWHCLHDPGFNHLGRLTCDRQTD